MPWLGGVALAAAAWLAAGADAANATLASPRGEKRPPPTTPPFPAFGSRPLRDYGTLALSFLFGSAATASGVGGGAIYVPLFDAVLGLGIRRATALSQVAISAGALAGVALLLTKRHPSDPSDLLVDLELAAVLTSPVLLGVGLGVLANSMLPSWLLTAALLALLALVVLLTVLKGRELHRLETRAKAKAAAGGGRPATPPPPPPLVPCPPTPPLVPSPPPPPPAAASLEDAVTVSQWGAHAEAAALVTLTPRRLRRSWAMQPAAAAAAADAALAAVDEEAQGGPPCCPPSPPAAPAPPPPSTATQPHPRHPLLTRASAAPLTILAALWAVLSGLQVWRARVPHCSAAWVAAIATQAGVAAVTTVALMARAVHCARARQAGAAQQVAPASCGSSAGSGGGCPPPPAAGRPATRPGPAACGREPGVRTPGRLAAAGAACVVAGFIGGLLGVGGGMVVAPLLLAMRTPPPRAAATSVLLVLFSSSSAATAAAATPGALDGLYVAAFAPVTAAAGAAGVAAAARFVKRSGRESLLVFLLAGVVAAGAGLTAGVSGPRAVADVRAGRGGLAAVC